ncbi:hypothetical protein A2X44_04955 [candidate division CPR3 bacterium GWF2_35_18]|uniref:Glycosyl transferase, group 1 n=1 Tax=candidate division CPR3 bacterium GW2011_GWF2_35_18 TaxID=1618350 RepID=A0A0G0BK34_UNCC3|nr:MAG: Glycosyl transferase, group 1 [candidate division CPR3 bacterium GW2011_GWF2_35_18]OGB63683.1 MAG: hypothetical protein A2X44_04955 [candidate division CPR3 bacterium GWF2_35_18]OGB64997.1 MAG: hypothetical protein A2250_01090 [candidate division CPR3 bacterium RIFOXYA2_FULL_35_13]OGB76592.1 MAG: hypothetical protein A2476_01400 [candidate division CPR3 bacterium RIFOXYC2_FULL_35_7]OGB79127.1 MAG: hypothetical protein A2296_04450 [candidate division CPR3 bacterium RIFOXYB2_FULL_35_8]
MKIAYIGQKGIPASYGGVERHVEELGKRLTKNPENEVYIYCRKWYVEKSQKLKIKNQNLKQVFIPSVKTKHLDTITHVLFSTLHALTKDYDVIHYQGIGPTLLSFIPRIFKPKTRIIATYHCADYEHQKWGFFARTMLKLGEIACLTFPHEVIVVSQNMQHYLEKRYHKKVTFIPNGINYTEPDVKALFLDKFGLKKNSYFLTVGRLVRHKGIHYLIEAYQKLYPKVSKKDKKLVIVGDSAFTDDYVQELKALSYGNANIVFTGYQTGKILTELFSNAYLYIQPSESEGMALTVLEAISYGIPVLTSDIPANLEVTGKNSFNFENKNVLDLKKKLKYATFHERKIKKLGLEKQKEIVKQYHWDKIVRKTFKIYYHNNNKKPSEYSFGPSFELFSVNRI